jgi:hypothetical protein
MLRQFAATYVSLQENLSNGEKISIIKWIKEATDDEIKSLLITGNYTLQKESVSTFDNTVGQLLDEVAGIGSAFKGFLSADGRLFTGVVDMARLNQIVSSLVKQSWEAGAGTGAFVGFGSAAIVALIFVVAHRAYKRFLSKAAKACNHLGGIEKTNCMSKYKIEATKKKIEDLRTGKQSCQHTKNSSKCEDKIDNKIKKLQSKLGIL